MNDLGFQHRFVAGTRPETLLLLHGTGGDEQDLLGLGADLLPGANLLSPRGNVLENGMPRFFRRLAEGIFDEEDLVRRTDELGSFLEAAAIKYGFDRSRVVAVGYSNGANIAASGLLLRPEFIAGAVLLRAMVPIVPERSADLTAVPIFFASGKVDPIVPVENSERLAAMLRAAGAEVSHRWDVGGHQLSAAELTEARNWLAQTVAKLSR